MIDRLKDIGQKLIRFLNSGPGLFVKIIISVGIIGYFFYTIDYQKFINVIRDIDYFFIVIIILLLVFRNLLSAVRFKVLVANNPKASIFILTKQYFIAGLFNIILPTVLGGDAVRVFLLEECDIKKKESALLIIIERFIGFFSLVLIAFISVFLINLPEIIFYFIIIITVLYSILVFIIFFPINKRFILNNFVEKNLKSLTIIRENRKMFARVLILSFIYQFFSIQISYIISVAFDMEISMFLFLAIVPIVWLFMMIPISIGGLGIREISFVYLFSLVGVDKESALIISLGTFLSFIISGIMGALVFFYDKIFLKIKHTF